MNETIIKAMLGKAFSGYSKSVPAGSYDVDETITVHVSGTAEKLKDGMAAPTHRIPYLTVIALILEKSGVTRDAATRYVREALTESMQGLPEERVESLESRIKDVEAAVSTVRRQVLDQLDKVPRAGKFLAEVEVELLEPAEESVEVEAPTAEEEQTFLRNAVLNKLATLSE